MPIHKALARRFEGIRPFAGLTVAVSSHLEAKTGVLIETLAKAGGQVVFTASVAATAQVDVVAALNTQPGIEGFIATDAETSIRWPFNYMQCQVCDGRRRRHLIW